MGNVKMGRWFLPGTVGGGKGNHSAVPPFEKSTGTDS